MIGLIIETSTDRGCVALAKEMKVVQRKDLSGIQNSQDILPAIKELLISQGLKVSDLTHLVVGVGPGSYTGIRVGAIVAKTISFALKIPIVSLSSLQAFVPDTEGAFAAVIDAKIGGAYFLKGRFEKGSIFWMGNPKVLPILQAIEELKDVSILAVPSIGLLKEKMEAASGFKIWQWQEVVPNADRIWEEALKKIAKGEVSTNGQLELLYLRKTQAEIERDSKKQ